MKLLLESCCNHLLPQVKPVNLKLPDQNKECQRGEKKHRTDRWARRRAIFS